MSATRMVGHISFSTPDVPLAIRASTALKEFKKQNPHLTPTKLMVHPSHRDQAEEIAGLGMEIIFTNNVLPPHCWVGAPAGQAKENRARPDKRASVKDIKAKHQAPAAPCVALAAIPQPAAQKPAPAHSTHIPYTVLQMDQPSMRRPETPEGIEQMRRARRVMRIRRMLGTQQMDHALMERNRKAIPLPAPAAYPAALIDQIDLATGRVTRVPRVAAPAVPPQQLQDPTEMIRQIARAKREPSALRRQLQEAGL